MIMRGKILRTNLTIPEEFEVSFDLYIKSLKTVFANIFRLTNSTDNNGNHGDRILLITGRQNNKLLFRFSVGSDPDYLFQTADPLPVQEMINVTVKQTDVGGTYKVRVFINDSMVHEVDNPSPYTYESVTAYASDTFSRPADGTIRNLRVLPGNYWFVLVLFF